MSQQAPRDMWMMIRFGQLEVDLSAEGVSYAPDVAHDMTSHLIRAFSEAISELRAHGVIGQATDDDDESDDPADEDDEDITE